MFLELNIRQNSFCLKDPDVFSKSLLELHIHAPKRHRELKQRGKGRAVDPNYTGGAGVKDQENHSVTSFSFLVSHFPGRCHPESLKSIKYTDDLNYCQLYHTSKKMPQ